MNVEREVTMHVTVINNAGPGVAEAAAGVLTIAGGLTVVLGQDLALAEVPARSIPKTIGLILDLDQEVLIEDLALDPIPDLKTGVFQERDLHKEILDHLRGVLTKDIAADPNHVLQDITAMVVEEILIPSTSNYKIVVRDFPLLNVLEI